MGVWPLGQEAPLEEEMAAHSSILAWRILWAEEPGRLLSIGSQRIRQSWSDLAQGCFKYKYIVPFFFFLITHELESLGYSLFSSLTQSCLTLCDPHGLQHARLACPSPTPGVYSNSCPFSRWCHPTISSSVIPFSSHLQSCPASGSFPMSRFFTSGGQSIGISASEPVLPMNIQHWFPLGLTGWISLHSKRLSKIFSKHHIQKHKFFRSQLSL